MPTANHAIKEENRKLKLRLEEANLDWMTIERLSEYVIFYSRIGKTRTSRMSSHRKNWAIETEKVLFYSRGRREVNVAIMSASNGRTVYNEVGQVVRGRS